MKALRYIDNTGVMRVQVVPDDYELTRDEQRRLGKDFWFEGLYEALGAKDDHDKKRKGQPAEPWLKEFGKDFWFEGSYSGEQPKDFGLASRYPEAVGGPGAPDDRDHDAEPTIEQMGEMFDSAHDRIASLKSRLEALRAGRGEGRRRPENVRQMRGEGPRVQLRHAGLPGRVEMREAKMEDELKPCPFCGAPLVLQGEYDDEGAASNFFAHDFGHPGADDCILSGVRIATLADMNTPDPKDVTRWNLRAAPPPEPSAPDAVTLADAAEDWCSGAFPEHAGFSVHVRAAAIAGYMSGHRAAIAALRAAKGGNNG
jgi:hypothetical protein